jgi:hypothetical protein
VEYIVDSWKRALSAWPDEASIVETDRWTQQTRRPGRRCLERADLARLIDATDLADSLAIRRAFALIMVWGSGTSNTRSYRNLPTAFAAQGCADRLGHAATTCREGDLASAYTAFSLPGVRRSFFTKWFAFAGHTPGRTWQPLILDDRVLRTLNTTLGVSTRTLAGSRYLGHRYAAYVHHLHAWSGTLREDGADCSAERLEWILFTHNGKALPGHIAAHTT